jgi:hypothetical protein
VDQIDIVLDEQFNKIVPNNWPGYDMHGTDINKIIFGNLIYILLNVKLFFNFLKLFYTNKLLIHNTSYLCLYCKKCKTFNQNNFFI